MNYKKKHIEIRDYIAYLIVKGKIKDGDEIFQKEYFTSKFRINPIYVDRAIDLMERQKLIEKIDNKYYFKVSEELKNKLKEEFVNMYMNEFLKNLSDIDVDIDRAIYLLNLRNISNG